MFKYPQNITVDRKIKNNKYIEQSWDENTLDFIKIEDGKGAKTNRLTTKNTKLSKPGKLILTDFGFNIYENARIEAIKVGWVDKVEGSDNTSKNPPIIPGVSMKLLNYPDGVVKSSKAKLGINYTKGESSDISLWNVKGSHIGPAPTYDIINSPDFGVMVSYAENISSNEGFILVDYLRLYIEWTDPKYSLKVVHEVNTAFLNDEIVYMVVLKNTNNIHQGKPIKVHINYDSDLSFVKYTDRQGGVYDNKKRIWNAKLDDDGRALLFLKFRVETKGLMECRAKTDFEGIEDSAIINIITPEFNLQTNYPNSTIEMVTQETIGYKIIATINNNLVTEKEIAIKLPSEIKVKNFKGDGHYDDSTGVWAAEFKNKKASLQLCIVANSSGEFNQEITIDDELVLAKKFKVTKSDSLILNQDENQKKILKMISPSGLQYLEYDENLTLENELTNNDFEVTNSFKDTASYPFNKEVAIKAENITMRFDLNPEKIDNFKEYFIKFIKRKIKKQEFLALDNVSFELAKGDRLGLIGLNGAGKSTLLKIVAGVMKPTEGIIEVSGKIAPLLELGAGFDPNYTGKENIFLNGSILGYSKEFLQEKYDEIAEFSELGRFLDVPIKNYSSGMKSKLGFSIATIVQPDILILDEVLSVGDAKFRKKSGEKIKSLFESGVTVLLVSHSINQIRELCNRAIWLENGKIRMMGSSNDVCDEYEKSVK